MYKCFFKNNLRNNNRYEINQIGTRNNYTITIIPKEPINAYFKNENIKINYIKKIEFNYNKNKDECRIILDDKVIKNISTEEGLLIGCSDHCIDIETISTIYIPENNYKEDEDDDIYD